MGLFDNLFGRKKTGANPGSSGQSAQQTDDPADLIAALAKAAGNDLNAQAAGKDAEAPATEEELMRCFIEYFAPNTDFYSAPGSEKYNAYFAAINAARDEMLRNADLFELATKWNRSRLIDLVKNPKPGMTNMLICGLIFRTGSYGVIKSHVYCVDFCDHIPNCIALYLLLTARKFPEDQRKQLIDAGTGSDTRAFKAAMESLRVLDPAWSFMIL